MIRLVRLNEVQYVTSPLAVEVLKSQGFHEETLTQRTETLTVKEGADNAPSDAATTVKEEEHREPTKAELLRQAKALGIKGVSMRSSVDTIKEALKAHA